MATKVDSAIVYIGLTGRKLRKCIEEHKKAVQLANFENSALTEHVWTESNHVAMLVSLPGRVIILQLRTITESTLTRTTRETLNRDCGVIITDDG